MKRPNRHSNPNSQAKRNRKGRFQYLRMKKRETRELSKAVLT